MSVVGQPAAVGFGQSVLFVEVAVAWQLARGVDSLPGETLGSPEGRACLARVENGVGAVAQQLRAPRRLSCGLANLQNVSTGLASVPCACCDGCKCEKNGSDQRASHQEPCGNEHASSLPAAAQCQGCQ
ncbi:hypothetical protein D9M73_251010 [compost metagenome]